MPKTAFQLSCVLALSMGSTQPVDRQCSSRTLCMCPLDVCDIQGAWNAGFLEAMWVNRYGT